jgi:hypothetical protein
MAHWTEAYPWVDMNKWIAVSDGTYRDFCYLKHDVDDSSYKKDLGAWSVGWP